MDFDKEIQKLVESAMKQEAPADVRMFAKRYRNLYVAMLQEGLAIGEISQLTAIALLVHLNPEEAAQG
jgi:hypothetical protein